MKNAKEQFRIITKGAALVVSEEILMDKIERSIESGKPLTIKFGLDPSAPDIHIGHAVPLRKIKQLQDLGHKTVIVIGDFTGKIGDPTGKSKTRKPLTDEQVVENAKTYCEQVFKIIDKDKTELRFNSEWLKKLNFEDVIKLAATTTVARMLERDDFESRYKNNAPIGLHEFFYPLMQAYDSVELKADIELGGTDQTFNILMGRNMQKEFGQEQQVAIFMPILEGTDGVEKMSKSLGNYIGVNEPAKVCFKKVMEIPDSLIIKYFELATDEHPDSISKIKERLADGENPRNLKMILAGTITKLYHGEEEASAAEKYFLQAFTNKDIPDEIDEMHIDDKMLMKDLGSLVTEKGYVKSSSEFRRLVSQGGVKVNGEKADSLGKIVEKGDILKIGKKIFVKLV